MQQDTSTAVSLAFVSERGAGITVLRPSLDEGNNPQRCT
jgi:hypothetical protein